MSSLTTRQLFPTTHNSQVQIFPFKSIPLSTLFITNKNNSSSTTRFFNLCEFSSYKNLSVVVKAASGDGSISPKDQDYEDGVSLGTMKLPLDVDLARFETLLFQVLLLIVNLFQDNNSFRFVCLTFILVCLKKMSLFPLLATL